ncbi:hypothetical protein [Thermoanaerobacter ethanolicus]
MGERKDRKSILILKVKSRKELFDLVIVEQSKKMNFHMPLKIESNNPIIPTNIQS